MGTEDEIVTVGSQIYVIPAIMAYSEMRASAAESFDLLLVWFDYCCLSEGL